MRVEQIPPHDASERFFSPVGAESALESDPRGWDVRLRLPIRWRAGLWLPFLLYAWTLGGGFVLDDLYMIHRIERYRGGEIASPRLFEFLPDTTEAQRQLDRTSFVWWAAGGERTAFFRPLAEASFLLDYALFGRNPLGYRLVSMAWFLLALLLVRRLIQTAGGSDALAELGTLFFGIAQTVSMPVAFISNRSDLLVVVGVTTASIAWWRCLRGGHSIAGALKWLALAALGYAFALCSKEVATPLAAVWLVHAWVERHAARTANFAAPEPSGKILIGYAVFYVQGGYGVRRVTNSWTGNFTGESIALIQRAGMLLSVWMIGIPAGLAVLFRMDAAAWGLCALAFAMILALLPTLRVHWRASAAFRFFAIWSLLFCMPPLIATAEPRLLCTASVGWGFCIGRMLVLGPLAGPGFARRAMKEWLLFANAGLAMSFGLGAALITERIERDCRDNVRDYVAMARPPLASGSALIVTQPRNRLELWVPGPRLAYTTGLRNVRLHYLAMDENDAPGVVRTVVDDHTIDITAPPPGVFGDLIGPGRAGDGGPIRVGATFANRDFDAEITRIEKGRITSVRFRFKKPLSDPSLTFVPPIEMSLQAEALSAP
jgi:hypothetical protein